MSRIDRTGKGGRREPAFRLPLEVVRPCWLIAIGDAERVEVLRSPLVSEGDSWIVPVRRFIAENRLVLAAREAFEDDGWIYGSVEMSVYVTPNVRNGALDGAELSVPWLGAGLAGPQ